VPTKSWPCKSNSVCLSSSPRAQNRVGAFWASTGVLAAGPVKRVYSAEPSPAHFRPNPVRLGLLAEPEPLADHRHEAGHGPTLHLLRLRRASAAPHSAAPLRLQPRHRSHAAAGLGPLHRQREQRSPQIFRQAHPGKSIHRIAEGDEAPSCQPGLVGVCGTRFDSADADTSKPRPLSAGLVTRATSCMGRATSGSRSTPSPFASPSASCSGPRRGFRFARAAERAGACRNHLRGRPRGRKVALTR
jgi:hypothetical protein